MRDFRERRIDTINNLIRRRAAAGGRKTLARLMRQHMDLHAYLSHRLNEIEAQVLAGDQRVRDDVGASILALVDAHNESCEAIVSQANANEQALKVIADRVLRTPSPAPHGRIPDDLNRRPRFHGN